MGSTMLMWPRRPKRQRLEAWGSHRNLFSIGEAEQVTDPKMMREPLAAPGKVIKVSRGSAAEQLKALPPEEKHKVKKPESQPKRERTPAAAACEEIGSTP